MIFNTISQPYVYVDTPLGNHILARVLFFSPDKTIVDIKGERTEVSTQKISPAKISFRQWLNAVPFDKHRAVLEELAALCKIEVNNIWQWKSELSCPNRIHRDIICQYAMQELEFHNRKGAKKYNTAS